LCAQPFEVLERQLVVDGAPPDSVLGLGLTDGELVLRGAARVHAGIDGERASLGDPRLAASQGVLVEHRCRRVTEDRAPRLDSVLAEVDVFSRRRHRTTKGSHYTCQSPCRRTGTRSPSVVTPVTSNSSDPIMKST